ncbi:MAG: alpha/beta hydrolase [Oscillospiraceae bacterium]|nr:alpha/beta hydrolase [Oscillospiraceae bacterium]MBQ7130298.1 alpha/beta hydrolase [Oscillospiraceae bacterium]
MLWNAQNGTLSFPDTTMDYVRFGSGPKTLVMLPGLGDGLRTTKGLALPMAAMYRKFIGEYTVYLFSRKNALPQGHTTRDMARDLKQAMDMLGIETADVAGVSMGGMIAQHLAADYPERVKKLVLVVTCPRYNPILTNAVSQWIGLAERGDHTALMDSNLRLIYSEGYYRKNKWLVPITGRLTKPKSYDRFFAQAQACLTHDASDRLGSITAPTLVMGGERDNCLGADASRELAAAIPGARLKMYPQWGHGLYEEERDFIPAVLDFLTE